MHLPLTFLFRLADYWHQLSDGTRDGIISGLIVAAVLAIGGLLLKFGKRVGNAVFNLAKSIQEVALESAHLARDFTGGTPVPLFKLTPTDAGLSGHCCILRSMML